MEPLREDLLASVEAMFWCLMSNDAAMTPEGARKALERALNECHDHDGEAKVSYLAKAAFALLRIASYEQIFRVMYQAEDNIEYGPP